MEKYTYLLLLIFSLAVPLYRSFETRIRFVQYWPALFAGIGLMMLVFIPWDIVFTANRIWWFNPDYVTGFYVFGLPFEEWLFFIVIPYCVIFSYEVIRYFFPRLVSVRGSLLASWVLGLLLLVLALVFRHQTYTFVVSLFASFILLLQPVMGSHKSWLSHFFVTYLVSLLPFFLVNGVLTSFPVVLYDNTQNLAIRLYSIPVEDAIYLLGMMLLVTMVYEKLKPVRPDNQKENKPLA